MKPNRLTFIPLALTVFFGLVLIAATAQAQSQSRGTTIQRQPAPKMSLKQIASKKGTKLGLDGYCPVCILNSKKWVMGDPNHEVTYDGVSYFFPGAGPKKTFLADPAKFVPALGGDCTVCLEKAGKRVPGSVQFATIHDDRLYLFPSDGERKKFNQTPDAFANTDLAADGNCIVCQVKAQKKVAGNPAFTAIHNGMRYQFPSDAERHMFYRTPENFVKPNQAALPRTKPQGSSNRQAMSPDKSRPSTVQNQVSIGGTTSCAACEYGVHPLRAPDELGMAVKSSDGLIYVIEDSHKRWPELYTARFDGKQVQVRGEVLKTDGKFAWLQPSELVVK